MKARVQYNTDEAGEDPVESGGPIPAFGERMEETSACLRPKPGPAPKINSKTLPRTTLPETAAEPVPHGWTLEASSAWEKSASADPMGSSAPCSCGEGGGKGEELERGC